MLLKSNSINNSKHAAPEEEKKKASSSFLLFLRGVLKFPVKWREGRQAYHHKFMAVEEEGQAVDSNLCTATPQPPPPPPSTGSHSRCSPWSVSAEEPSTKEQGEAVGAAIHTLNHAKEMRSPALFLLLPPGRKAGPEDQDEDKSLSAS